MALLRPILRRCLLDLRRPLLVDDQRTWRGLEVLGGTYHLAATIKQQTDRPHVGIMLPTSGAFAAALLATWQAGRVPVPLNYLLTPEDLRYVIEDAGLDCVLTAGKLLDHIGGDSVLPDGVNAVKLETLNFKGLPPVRWPAKPKDDDLALILYTSGTSGKPKGVMLSHANLEANARGSIQHAGINHNTSFLGVLPQFHSFGVTVLTLMPLLLGAKVVYTARFVPKKLTELIKEHRPNIFVGVPSMYGALLAVKGVTPEDWASVNMPVVGGEPLPDAVRLGFAEKLNVHLLEGYGLTETAPVCHWATPTANKTHSVGKPVPGVRHFIVDDNNHLLGPDEEGEILLAGPNLMMGYYKLPELTDEVVFTLDVPGESGKPEPLRVFRTGDIGKTDADGFLYITGRKKEMLIIAGENVFPREIEEVLNHCPGVGASAVIGKQDDTRGEVPIAFVEPCRNVYPDCDANPEGQGPDPTAVRQYAQQNLPAYKVPREVRVLNRLPRNPTGKILRRQLIEHL
ncbi:MAG: AMP-binding protein [Planctomycetota bacterium]